MDELYIINRIDSDLIESLMEKLDQLTANIKAANVKTISLELPMKGYSLKPRKSK